MSSPATMTPDDEYLSSDYSFCEYCKPKYSDNFNPIRNCTCYLKNFPNVGSSPVFDDDSDSSTDSQNRGIIFNNNNNNNNKFENNIFDDDTDEDEGRDEENIQGYDEIDIEDELDEAISVHQEEEEEEDDCEEEQELEDEEEQEQVQVQEHEEDEEEAHNLENQLNDDDEVDEDIDDDIDLVIIHNTIENSKTLSTALATNYCEKKPQSIIKKTSFGILKQISSTLDDPLITQQNTLNNEKIAQTVKLTNLELSNNNTTHSSNANSKPKVRFSLDINYEKEREWSRINKILGDVSKYAIEWTDEVEV